MRTWNLMLAAALLASSPTPSLALTDAQKCESSFELASAKYAQCRLVAESRLTKSGSAGSYATAVGRCEVKFTDAMSKAVTKYGGANCTSEVPGALSGYLTVCSNDVAAASAVGGSLPAYAGGLRRTGQTSCWDVGGVMIPCTGTGQDGDIQAGSALAHVDNGDGTVTDTTTGLMWEKQSRDGSVHDMDNTYSWAQALGSRLAALNASGGFAGHTDWRLPNRRELESLVSIETNFPATSSAMNTACAPGCSVLGCSCTKPYHYWSSSTDSGTPTFAWLVEFGLGSMGTGDKTVPYHVRAVRGGS